jgi:mono/diheme cytochrome c family protein
MRRFLLALIALAVVGGAAFWFLTMPQTVAASALAAHTPNLENGKTMFYAGGCTSCHAVPDAEDKTRLGGGLELKTRFGSFFVPNISPDPTDGIGNWSEADFASAMLKGTAGGQHLYPSFPYASYQHMALADVRDLFAFIKTLPAVSGRIQDHRLNFPYNIRFVLGGWKWLYLDGKPFTPDATQTAQWNRGAYLVNGPGHCAECHSPRDRFGGIVAAKRFSGGPDPEGEGDIPNITPAGIGDYSLADIEEILTTGSKPDGDTVGGSMAAVSRNLSQIPKDDRTAIAVYLKSLPAVEGMQ